MVSQRRRGVRVLAACSLAGMSHLQPLIPFLDQARQDGAETLVVGPPELGVWVREKGHEFLAGGEPPREQVRLVRERFQRAPIHGAWVLGNRELFGRLAVTAMLPVMESAIRDWQPNVILHETCEYASAVAGVRLGVPVGQVALSPAEVEWGSIKVASLALNEHLDGVTDALRMSPYLTRFPATLDPSPFPRTWRYREPIAPRRGALPAWWGPCAAGPLVYVSFGTIVVQMPFAEDLYRAVIEAVDGLPARVLMTTGRGFDVSRLREVPGNVHVEAWIEQLADVLGEAELVVCHGGPGTVYGALAAGVPLVAVPLFADQFANSHTVVQAGTGIQVLPEGGYPGLRDLASRLDASRIRAAIQTVLADRSFRESAASVSAEMAAASTVGDVLARLVASARPAGVPL